LCRRALHGGYRGLVNGYQANQKKNNADEFAAIRVHLRLKNKEKRDEEETVGTTGYLWMESGR
jgi:hypothetical protein